MNLGTAQIIQGNALNLPLPDSSVDLVCTSPPYFGLRSYQDAGVHYDEQIGSEATPTEFLEALLAATREMVRVLKPSGSIFVNLGDKYSGPAAGNGGGTTANGGRLAPIYAKGSGAAPHGIRTKSLLGIPWRYAIQCIDELGLILRAEIIWAKPNGLPESVTDRVRRSHEQWFHMVKQPRYYSAVDEIREAQTGTSHGGGTNRHWKLGDQHVPGTNPVRYNAICDPASYNPLGKLPGSVWTIPTQPLTVPPELGVDHFAAYPMEWPRRIILGWTPNGICTGCGEGRRPVKATDWDKIPHTLTLQRNRNHTDQERCRFGQLFSQWQDSLNIPTKALASLFPSATGGLTGCVGNWRTGLSVMTPDQRDKAEVTFGSMPPDLRSLIGEMEMLPAAKREMRDSTTAGRNRATGAGLGVPVTSITGYVCACPTPNAPTTPSVILDPFGGTGTTALVAKALGRTGITIDLSSDYCRLAQWRCNDPRELAAALQVEKPDPVHPDQLDLFSGIE